MALVIGIFVLLVTGLLCRLRYFLRSDQFICLMAGPDRSDRRAYVLEKDSFVREADFLGQ